MTRQEYNQKLKPLMEQIKKICIENHVMLLADFILQGGLSIEERVEPCEVPGWAGEHSRQKGL